MLARVTPARVSRRRLVSGLAVAVLSVVAAGCDRRLLMVPAPSTAPTQKPEPPPLAPATPRTPIGATFGRVLVLEGVTVERDDVKAGEYLRIWLHWQSAAPSQEDFRSIGRVVGLGERVLASEDDQIGGRKRHLSRWQVGEKVVDEMRLRVTPSSAAGEYGLAIGVLRSDNLTPVPITARAVAAATWQEDAVLVGTVVIVAG